MKHLTTLGLALLFALSVHAAETPAPVSFGIQNLKPGETFEKTPFSIIFIGGRAAFPYRTTVISLEAPMALSGDRIELTLHPINPAKIATAGQGELEKIKVAAGPANGELSPVPAEIQIERKEKVIVVTLKGKFENARRFRIYAPRSRKDYELYLTGKDVKVFSQTEVPKLDESALAAGRTQIEVTATGLKDHDSAANAAKDVYKLTKFEGRLAFPYAFRSISFGMKQSHLISEIVLILEHAVATATWNPRPDLLKVWKSDDNKTFTEVPVKASYDLVRSKNGKTIVLLRIPAGFSARYVRMMIPGSKSSYVFAVTNIKDSLRVYSAAKTQVTGFSVPVQADGKFTVGFRIEGIQGSKGTVRLVDARNPGKPLWSRNFSELPAGPDYIAEITPPAGWKPGIRTLRLECAEEGTPSPFFRAHKFRYAPGETVLKISPDHRYIIPADGIFTVYLEISGIQPVFQVKTPDGAVKKQSLPMWYPGDAAKKNIRGEVIALCRKFKKGDTLEIVPLKAGSILHGVRLAKASEADAACFNAAPDIHPAAIELSDGFSDFFFPRGIETVDDLKKRIDTAADHHSWAFDWCIGTTAVNYPSKIATVMGQQKNADPPLQGDKRAVKRIKALLDAGHDPVAIIRTRARERKLPLMLTLRGSAWYTGKWATIFNSEYLSAHPEFLQRMSWGGKGAPSYAYPEVRNFYLGIIRELAAYQPDWICIEFLRHPPFFGFDPPLIAEYQRRWGNCTIKDFNSPRWQQLQCEIMTDFLTRVRQILDAKFPRIRLLISFDHEAWYSHGLDLKTGLKKGLFDAMSPGIYRVGYRKFFDLTPFRKMIAESGHPCLILPFVEGTIQGQDPTIEEELGLIKIKRLYVSNMMFRKLFADFSRDGAVGIRPFNTGGHGRALADRADLKRHERFVFPLLDVRRFGNQASEIPSSAKLQ